MSSQLEQLQSKILENLSEMKAIDVVVLDVEQYSAMMERLVVCSGRSNRHVKSIADSLVQEMKSNGCQPLSVSGTQTAEWVLVDLGGIVVHVMLPEKREFYQLEKLWSMPSDSDEQQRG